jgi:hypothetical protein
MNRRIMVFILVFSVLFSALPASAATSAVTAPAATVPVMLLDAAVDIRVAADVSEFTVFSAKKLFAVKPIVEKNILLVQADKILSFLGYQAKYDMVSKTMTFTNGKASGSAKAGTAAWKLNGKTLKFSIAAKAKSGMLLVPMIEFFRALGYPTTYDAKAKTARILRSPGIDTGNIAFFNKSSLTIPQMFFSFKGVSLAKEAFPDIMIQALYAKDGVITGYAYDKAERVNKLVMYEKGKFKNLLVNFDLVDTYEFADGRVFYGYDNAEKVYKLYRLVKGVLSLVVGDCYSSEQIRFKDSIILNRYDSSRNYSVVRVDGSWQVTELDTRKTITESFSSDNWLYMKATPQEGAGVYLLVFNGASILRVNINEANVKMEEIRLIDFRVCDGRVYGILPTYRTGSKTATVGKLYRFDESTAVLMPNDPLDLDLTLIESYNGKLYLSGNYKDVAVTRYADYEMAPDGLYVPLAGPRFDGKELQFISSMVEYGTLFLTGKNYNANRQREDVTYIQRDGAWNYALDVPQVKTITQTVNGLYLKVRDYDRATPNTLRDSLLFLSPALDISNAAIDYSLTNQAVIGSSLVFAGANKITKRSGVSRHDKAYTELIPGIAVGYWEVINNQVFTGGKQDGVDSLHLVGALASKKLKDLFEAKIVSATKNPDIYLVYGVERDKKSVWNGDRVLYLYDMRKNTYAIIMAGVDIAQILRY